MGSKGQTSLYVVIAALIIVMVAVYFALSSAKGPDQNAANTAAVGNQLDVSSMQEFAVQCVKTTAMDGIVNNGLQGGYYQMPETYLILPTAAEIPFYYYHGDNYLPTLGVLENELSHFIDDRLDFCIRQFYTFRQQGYTVQAGKITAGVTIFPTKVNVDVKYPVSVSKDGLTSQMNDFPVTIEVPYGQMYWMAANITQDVVADPYFVHVTKNFAYMDATGLLVNTADLDGSVIYAIKDNATTYDGKSLFFLFATEPEPENHAPLITSSQDTFALKAGVPFNTTITASDMEGDTVFFSDNSTLFTIGYYSGYISFTPNATEVGSHLVNITASDGKDNSSKIIDLEVGQ